MIFNVTGNRDVNQMLRVVVNGISLARPVFVPIVAQNALEHNEKIRKEMDMCAAHAALWKDVSSELNNEKRDPLIYSSVESALNSLSESSEHTHQLHVLVTGSLYLVGAVYEFIGMK